MLEKNTFSKTRPFWGKLRSLFNEIFLWILFLQLNNFILRSVLSCQCTEVGIINFVENFHEHQSESLKIIWQMDRSHFSSSFITDFYLSLINKTPWLCKDLNLRSKRKQFRAKFGEQVAIWNGDKTLYIQVNFIYFYGQNALLVNSSTFRTMTFTIKIEYWA